MFEQIRRRIGDAKTLKALCLGAERHARSEGRPEPGAEHFLLAALELPDGSARRAFERVGADPAAVRAAIAQQYADALRSAGGDASALGDAPQPLPPPGAGLYRASPSGQAVVVALARRGATAPLRGADVVAVVAAMKQGVAARTSRAMGVDAQALAQAARAGDDFTG